tara:strand:+ start:2652 stop:3293 length:642 start_codon:yes stop_codon:yes gene_type:complete
MNVLVIAPHPDDEVLGMGGTIRKLSNNKHKIILCVVSEGASAQYDDAKMKQVRKDSCKKSGKILGISNFHFLNFPDMKLSSIPHLEINQELEKIIKKYKPKIVYTSPKNDLNRDHEEVFNSTLVSCRPQSGVKQIFSYELPGFSKHPLNVNTYENIEKEFSYKIKAFKMYKSEVMKFPHPRSLLAIENLSIYRGVQSGLKKAEAFELIKSINN